MTPLRALSPEARRTLRGALEGGSLAEPYTSLGTARFVGARQAEAIAPELARLASLGMRGAHIAELLAALEDAPPPAVELVWSGPDEGATETRDTGVVARELFASARRSVVITGFALHQGKKILRILAERMDADPMLAVRMFLHVDRKYGDTTAASILLREFRDRFVREQWPGKRLPEAFYDPRTLAPSARGEKRASLHAKCIVVDEEHVLVTSANLTQAAQERNVEIGVLAADASLGRAIVRHLETLVGRGAMLRLGLE